MSDTILSGDFTVYYEADNRQKRLEYTGSGTTYTVNELYSALQDQFDELGQMDDGVPMSAQTPTEYTIGIIDAGDDDPWYIDPVSVEYLTNGALKTSSWTRSLPGDGTGDTGIVKVLCTPTNIVSGDVGNTITHADGDSGVLLYVDTDGLWIRPDDNTLANDFNSTSGILTCNAHTSGAQSAAASTGESLWANIYSIGTIADDTHLYVIQDGSKLISEASGATVDWWEDDHIDVLLKVKELDTEIDEAVVQVFGRQYGKTYTHFEVDLSNGGRNPIPLAAGADLNNTSGWRTFTGSSGGSDFDAGNYMYVGASWSAATVKAVITDVSGTVGDPVLEYYLIGDLTDFANLDSVKEYDPTAEADGDGTCTAGTPADANPAVLSGVSATFSANETFDINEDGTTENYSIVIDVSDEALADVYEWSKWLTMRGQTDQDTNTDGLDGEQYIGSDYKLVYASMTGTVSEGDVVTGTASGAVGTIVALNTTDNITILRSSRGTFTAGDDVYLTENTHELVNTTPTVITPINAAPFGIFAGGTWFCAPGVVLDNVKSTEANNYQLTSDDGVVVKAPTKVSVAVGNTRAGDSIAVFRLTTSGGIIEKDTYNATVMAVGDASLVVGTGINTDEPGKSLGGIVRLVDEDGDKEYRLRFSSWDTSTFTLANLTGTMDDTGGTTTTTNLHHDGQAFLTTVKVGDLVLNTTQSDAVAYVTAIVDDDNLTISPAITGQASGDAYEINAVPIITTTSDTVYVPLVDAYETTGTSGSPGTESTTITYVSDVPVRIRARQAGDIVPYEADSTVTNTGMSNNVIRTADSIYN